MQSQSTSSSLRTRFQSSCSYNQ